MTADASTFTPATFARDVLELLGAPVSSGNVAFLEDWTTAEGGHWHNSARYNPLDTTLQAPGSVNFNSGRPGTGVQAYPDVATGEAATVSTLTEQRYADVVAALKGNDQSAAAIAVVKSPWDETHYGWSPRRLWPQAPASIDPSAPTPVPATSTSSSAQGSLAGLNLNPFDGFGLFSSAKAEVAKVVVNAIFLTAGLALVVLGVYKTADPGATPIKDLRDSASQAATTAAVAA